MKKFLRVSIALFSVICLCLAVSATAFALSSPLRTVIIGDDGSEIIIGDPIPEPDWGGEGPVSNEGNQAGKAPVVTKHPTSERVKAGESAVFIARADNAEKITWFVISSSGATYYTAADAPAHFNGLSGSGFNAERLELYNIPKSLNDWTVQCRFEGGGMEVWSNPAKITVEDAAATPSPSPSPSPSASPAISASPVLTPAPSAGIVPGIPGADGTSGQAGIGSDGNLPVSGSIEDNIKGTARSEGKSHVLAYVLASIAGIGILGVCGTLIYMKKHGMTLGGSANELFYGIDEDSFDEAVEDRHNDFDEN